MSRWAAGSSSSRTRGSWRQPARERGELALAGGERRAASRPRGPRCPSARARARRRCRPLGQRPERPAVRVAAEPRRALRRSARPAPSSSERHERHGAGAARRARQSASARSRSRTSPAATGSSPASARTSVDLPAAFGPTTRAPLPRAASRLTSMEDGRDPRATREPAGRSSAGAHRALRCHAARAGSRAPPRGGERAERQVVVGAERARAEVGQHDQQGAAQERRGQQTAASAPDERPQRVRRDQADEGDRARHRRGGAGDERGQRRASRGASRARAGRATPLPPRRARARRAGGRAARAAPPPTGRRPPRPHVGPAASLEPAGEPEQHGLDAELLGGDEQHRGARRRRARRPRCPVSSRPCSDGRPRGVRRAGRRRARRPARPRTPRAAARGRRALASPSVHGEHGPERGARADAEQARVGERVAEDGLQRRPDHGQAAADERGQQHARQAHRTQDRFGRSRRARLRRRSARAAASASEHAGATAAPRCPRRSRPAARGRARGEQRDATPAPPAVTGAGRATARSGCSRRAELPAASAACWLSATSSSVGISTMRPSRTARSCESSGCAFSASAEPGQVPTSTTSGSVTKARSAPGGAMPAMPISRPTLTPPASSIRRADRGVRCPPSCPPAQ